ncbi:MAG: FkbM family methyltransferase [Candidatus Acidiferrales bacterium]
MSSVLEREANEFERVSRPFAEEALVLFGAGNLGRVIRTKLQPLGTEPLAFTDNNPKLWGSTVEGIRVLSPADAAARFGSSATFVVSIWGVGSRDRMGSRVKQLRELGCRNVLPFASLFWKYPDLFLPHHVIDQPRKVLKDATAVRAACMLWDDEFSRREYVAQLRWRLRGDFDSMADPVPESIYFPQDLFALGSQEVFVDCGAFNGDTIQAFLETTNSQFEKIFAFEPDPANFAALKSLVATLEPATAERIVADQKAVGAAARKVRFAGLGSDGSAIDANGEIEVECISLDEGLLEEARPTHLKMDIEGAELDALAGSRDVIARDTPILAICSYHRQSDLWRIPLLIHSIHPDYRMYLRPHLVEGWDVVCYAVPPERKIA